MNECIEQLQKSSCDVYAWVHRAQCIPRQRKVYNLVCVYVCGFCAILGPVARYLQFQNWYSTLPF